MVAAHGASQCGEQGQSAHLRSSSCRVQAANNSGSVSSGRFFSWVRTPPRRLSVTCAHTNRRHGRVRVFGKSLPADGRKMLYTKTRPKHAGKRLVRVRSPSAKMNQTESECQDETHRVCALYAVLPRHTEDDGGKHGWIWAREVSCQAQAFRTK